MSVPGHEAAMSRVHDEHGGSIFPAFDSLGLGFDHGEAVDFLTPSILVGLHNASVGTLIGVCLAFAAVAVEADRAQRDA